MYCRNCGNKISKESKFCDKCGAEIKKDKVKKQNSKKVNDKIITKPVKRPYMRSLYLIAKPLSIVLIGVSTLFYIAYVGETENNGDRIISQYTKEEIWKENYSFLEMTFPFGLILFGTSIVAEKSYKSGQEEDK